MKKSQALARPYYRVKYVINRLPNPPFKEQLTVRDFTSKY